MTDRNPPPAEPRQAKFSQTGVSRAGFTGTQAVVTGSSSGIGRATAIELARAGASGLVIHYRKNRDGAEETAALARQVASEPLEIEILQADLIEPADQERLVESSFARFNNLQTWINNSGGDVLTGSMAESDFLTKLDYLWQVDVKATIALSRKVGERLRIRPDKKVPASMVFIGWDQAPRGMEGDAGQLFGTIKAAVMAFANSLAQDLAPDVRVNSVAPGWTQTAWAAKTSEYWDRRAKEQSLMARWGSPQDIAAAILYAANPDHSFVSGQTIEVNGGWNRKFLDRS